MAPQDWRGTAEGEGEIMGWPEALLTAVQWIVGGVVAIIVILCLLLDKVEWRVETRPKKEDDDANPRTS